ncbi:hypothetical protein GON26_04835 [Flavobacterium sp. GA093]|uniref:Uncharacterized protein n=1 Tax=Flavobacterium hydrocarbonoxydans TaxID=2683249 RepID=A0A6I4NRB3_9FLAO|nr:hypothetical protein [Flavobacterium hydrocarbonoxydans]MWB93674.1 hypothetical protein [Flavobacterium hydrocarbonoxydans]
MLRNFFFSTLLLSAFTSFSQDVVNSTSIELKRNRDIFQAVNDAKKEVTLFISDKIKVKAVRLDEKMQIIDSISSERPNTKIYDKMAGYNISHNNTQLFWSSNDYEDIFSQLYDFSNRKVVTKQYTLMLKNEKVLEKFSGNNDFYILTVIKNSNNLRLHIFDNAGTYTTKIIDLKGFHFFDSYYKRTDLYGVLGENLLPYEAPFSLKSINVENPTSLTDGAKKRKCYFNNKQIVLTFDANIEYTQLIIIDLENFSATEKMIKKPYITGDPMFLKSNSFYFDNKLYQIKTSSDLLYFTIKDLEDNIIKEYFANAAKPIDFKNSEIYQEGGDFGGKRTLEKTSQFIRKVNNLNSGLSCYHIGQNTLITFGGVSAAQQSTGQIAMSQFGLIGAIVSAAFLNPTMESFNSYSNKKVVKIEGLFDSEGNNIKGDLQPLAFDKIRTFFDNNSDVSSQTLFKMGDYYYLGYYDNNNKKYIIRKFAD